MPREKNWTLVRKNQFKRAPIGKKSLRKVKKRADRQEFDIIDPHGPQSSTKTMTPKSIKRQLVKAANRMKDRNLVRQFVEHIHNIIHEQIQAMPRDQQTDSTEITLYFRAYGVGNFSTSPSARKQMALFLATRDYFSNVVFVDPNEEKDEKQPDFQSGNSNAPPAQPYVFSWQKNRAPADVDKQRFKIILGTIDVFDPAFTDLERQALVELDMNPLASNDEALVAVSESSSSFLFAYMPHCPRTLYNNLLSSNFTQHQLCRIIVVGNSFQEYGNLMQPSRSDQSNLCYVLRLIKLNAVVEGDMERWMENLEGSRRRSRRKGRGGASLVMTEESRQNIQVEHDAFAFQHIHYFPVRHLSRISTEEWESMHEELVHEQMIPENMEIDDDMVMHEDGVEG